MKILHVASDLYPNVVGGVGIHVHEIATWQVVCGHVVSIFTINHNNSPPTENINGYSVRRFDRLLKLLGNSFSFQLVPALLNGYNQYDVVHAHSHLFFSTIVCSFIRLIRKKPLVVTSHGLFSASAPAWLNIVYTHLVSKQIFKIADQVVCLTEIEKNNLIQLGIKGTKISVIPNGVDTAIFSPPPTPYRKISKQILWVGRLVPGKGVDFLIDAFVIINKKHPDARLVLVGDGDLWDRVHQKISELDLTAHVYFIQELKHSELPDLYNASEIFVLPSLMEGMPLTLLEAMSCGIPIVITDFPHLKDLVDGSGIMIPPKNAERLADAINLLLEDEKFAHNLGSHGRWAIENGYTWENTSRKTLALYEKIND
jgi:glycosyltransferase involved in cell wall biosynthesis